MFRNYGTASARLEDLELIALTHFHTDHSADLPALLKGLYFSDADWRRPLPISGPSGAGAFPSLKGFLNSLFAPNGAYAYLGGLLEGSDDLPRLQVIEVDAESRKPVEVLNTDRFSVRAVGVHHGVVPTLGYRIDIDDLSIGISGDQNLDTDYFIDMIAGADLLVMPAAVPQSEHKPSLHARPSDIGRAADRADVATLLLSHWMGRSLREQDENIELVREYYSGPVIAAEDGLCIPLTESPGL